VEDVLTELFTFGAVFRSDRSAGVDIEAGVFPGFHPGDQFEGNEFVAE